MRRTIPSLQGKPHPLRRLWRQPPVLPHAAERPHRPPRMRRGVGRLARRARDMGRDLGMGGLTEVTAAFAGQPSCRVASTVRLRNRPRTKFGFMPRGSSEPYIRGPFFFGGSKRASMVSGSLRFQKVGLRPMDGLEKSKSVISPTCGQSTDRNRSSRFSQKR